MSTMKDFENTTYRRLAILLIIIGLLLASDSLLNLSFVYKLWPVIILIPGIGLVGIFVKRKARGDIFLASGEYLICFSGLAIYCNFTSWRNMAKIWPLFIAFLGIVFVTLFLLHLKKRFLLLLGLLHLSLSIFFFHGTLQSIAPVEPHVSRLPIDFFFNPFILPFEFCPKIRKDVCFMK